MNSFEKQSSKRTLERAPIPVGIGLGQFLNQMQRLADISTNEMAEPLGVSGQALRNWMNGAACPRSDSEAVRKIVEIFGLIPEQTYLLLRNQGPWAGSKFKLKGGGTISHAEKKRRRAERPTVEDPTVVHKITSTGDTCLNLLMGLAVVSGPDSIESASEPVRDAWNQKLEDSVDLRIVGFGPQGLIRFVCSVDGCEASCKLKGTEEKFWLEPTLIDSADRKLEGCVE